MNEMKIWKLLVEEGLLTKEQEILINTDYATSSKTFTDILFQKVSVQTFKDLFFYKLPLPGSHKDIQKESPGPEHSRENIEQLIGQMLIRLGLLNMEQYLDAINKRTSPEQKLGDILIQQGLLTPDKVFEEFNHFLQIPFIDITNFPINYQVAHLIPETYIRDNKVLPIKKEWNEILLATIDPMNQKVVQDIKEMTGCEIQMVIVDEKALIATIGTLFKQIEIREVIAEAHEEAAFVEKKVVEETPSPEPQPKSRIDTSTKTDIFQAIVPLVNSIISKAVLSRATDIHYEPQQNQLRIRYRIDGMLYDVMTISKEQISSIIARIKVMSNMDITERRRPQDGHLSYNENERTFDVRVATLPTQYGEKLVMRLLDEKSVLTGMSELGLEPENLTTIQEMCHKPYGMILVTGPIGSGKTTTLYSALSEINTTTSNIVTIEDPIEYQLPGINQVNVDPKSDLTFATGLRAILRQDADIMMVGEIRDTETASIAVRAAMTGHLLFSTLHTNDAPGAITTLQHLGIKPFLIAGSLIGVIAQRLVRVICPHCKESYNPSIIERHELGLSPKQKVQLYKGTGCDICFNSGFIGRTAVFEVMKLSEELRKLIVENASEAILREAAIKQGMNTLPINGINKVLNGITTYEEYVRVVYI